MYAYRYFIYFNTFTGILKIKSQSCIHVIVIIKTNRNVQPLIVDSISISV